MTVAGTSEGQASRVDTATKSERSQRKPRGQVIIFGMWCKGCKLCVEFCPTGVLAFNEDDHPIVVKPENCTACHWCDTHCPDLAIVVKPISAG